jgi:lysophospholipase L1-like esterase
MISTTDYWTRHNEWENVLRRRDVIMESYLKARANGDKNVYFIDGMSFNAVPHQYERTVDGVHPNDAGFIRMAESIGTFIRHILEKKRNS